MDIEFQIKGNYTLVGISGMAVTIRSEIIITAALPKDRKNRQRYSYKHKYKAKEFFLPAGDDLEKHLIFEGHDLPFTVDSETDRFCGDANFNFVTDKPRELKTFIVSYCLNPSPAKFNKVFYTGTDRNDTEYPESLPLFTESNE
jgi:hypothetical protein